KSTKYQLHSIINHNAGVLRRPAPAGRPQRPPACPRSSPSSGQRRDRRTPAGAPAAPHSLAVFCTASTCPYPPVQAPSPTLTDRHRLLLLLDCSRPACVVIEACHGTESAVGGLGRGATLLEHRMRIQVRLQERAVHLHRSVDVRSTD